MAKYQRPQVFPGDFDAVRAGHRTFEIRHDCVRSASGVMAYDPAYPVGWIEPERREPRWVCGRCGCAWKDGRVKELAGQFPGGTFWRQEVASG